MDKQGLSDIYFGAKACRVAPFVLPGTAGQSCAVHGRLVRMLAADKLLLQSNLRQNAIKLKEKEFTLHHDKYAASFQTQTLLATNSPTHPNTRCAHAHSFSNVGTQSAVLAGFAITALIEFQPPPGTNRILKVP